jgi:hypothetical protein
VEWGPSPRWDDPDLKVKMPSRVCSRIGGCGEGDKLPHSYLTDPRFKERIQRFVCTGEYRSADTVRFDGNAAYFVGLKGWRTFP